MFDFKDKVVIVTGAAQGIGKCISETLKKAGAKVCIIDVQDNEYFKGDISDKSVYRHVETMEDMGDCVMLNAMSGVVYEVF